jgi:transcription initiation factor TFIIH subunit 2
MTALNDNKNKDHLFFNCNGCDKSLTPDTNNPDIVICEHCLKIYCLDCDIFIHDTLLSCPTCELLA